MIIKQSKINRFMGNKNKITNIFCGWVIYETRELI